MLCSCECTKRESATTFKPLPVSMTLRSHLFSYRTQKLSSVVQKVLGWTRPGRICRCRFPKQKTYTNVYVFCFIQRFLNFSTDTWLPCPAFYLQNALYIKHNENSFLYWRLCAPKIGMHIWYKKAFCKRGALVRKRRHTKCAWLISPYFFCEENNKVLYCHFV